MCKGVWGRGRKGERGSERDVSGIGNEIITMVEI